MYLIVGLGNPEPEYSFTRHNMGFDVINKLSKKYEIPVERQGFKSLYGIGEILNNKVILCKPQTFMNLSGNAIIEIANFYKIDLKDIIVIFDDIDTKEGVIKLRKKGGAGTHNGMKSVIQNIQTEKFPRVRIGIGKPEQKGELIQYVIGPINKEDKEILDKATTRGKEAVIEIIKNGVDIAMNKFN